MASSLNIYSIPECSTDDEMFDDDDDCDLEPSSKLQKEQNVYTSLKYFPNSSLVASSCINIKLLTKESEEDPFYSDVNVKTQVSRSLFNISEFHRNPDNGTLENDNADLFSNAASCDVKAKERITMPMPYLNIEDYNSKGNSPYEKLLIKHPNATTSNLNSSYSVINFNNTAASASKNQNETYKDKSSKANLNIETTLVSSPERRRSTTGAEISNLHPHNPRGRSGSVQWIQNILQNLDHRCRSLLDLRRHSDITEEGIRKSNGKLDEMEHSEEEPSKPEPQSSSGAKGRRYSENIIGKQHRRFPFSSGIGHLRGLWKDRNENKKHDVKDIDQLRPDVCPLFNFPRKSADEDEVILDALRQAMRKCTIVDPSARPPSASVFDQLSQIVK